MLRVLIFRQYEIMKEILVFILIFVIFTFCRKEDKPTNGLPTDECYELPRDFFDERWDGTRPYSTYKHAWWPGICPFDKNKMVYREKVDNSEESIIKIRNLATGESQKLMDGAGISYTLSWSINDWILFGNTAGKIFKIKSNGDSLQQLLNGGYFFPKWSPYGEKFIAKAFGGGKSLLVSANVDVLKILPIDYYSWIPMEDNIVVAYITDRDNINLVKYNLEDDTYETIISLKEIVGENEVGIFECVDKSNIIWYSSKFGMYKINTESKSSMKIRNSCKFGGYGYFTKSPENNYFYSHRIDYKYLNDTPWSEVNIWRISIDGKELKKINVQ